MVKFKALDNCIDKKTGKSYKKSEVYDVTVKEIEDFEKRLKDKGYTQDFFKRVKKETPDGE